jgi:hypothetical protein
MLIENLKADRIPKEFAQIAVMCYHSGKMSRERPTTFKRWYEIFCECVGCEQKKYDNTKRLINDTSDDLKAIFNFL